MFGVRGAILRVDLTKGEVTSESLDEHVYKLYLGGRGLGAYLLFNELKPGIDPLSPENKLVFATGPLVGAPFPGNARFHVMAKSPLTSGWGEASGAGWFGIQLKRAGFDAIVVEGKSPHPVYLWVHEGEVEIRDARPLWGKVIGEVQAAIRRELEQDAACVVSIGPGGENLVRYACVIGDLHRAAGRCGLGAVMGSKNLKAVAAYGTEEIAIADPPAIRRLAKIASKEAMDGWGGDLQKNGTDNGLEDLSGSGRLPTKNFQETVFDGDEKITGETMTQTILKRNWHCYACPVGCIRIVEAETPYEVDPAYGGPEYETCGSFGSMLLIDDLVTISKANELCNKYTLDTISTGVTIAFAMECYDRGLLSSEDVDGLDLTWGNGEAVLALISKIANREGVGDLLAEGTKRAASRIGRGADMYAMQVKGQELPMHEPRGKKGVGLSYATSNRGACHLQTLHDDNYEMKKDLAPEIGLDTPLSRYDTGSDKARAVKVGQDLWALYDSLIVCKFTPYPAGISIPTLHAIFTAVTGWDSSISDLMRIGERTWNLCRAFNVREGFTRNDDVLPARMAEPITQSVSQGQALPKDVLDAMLDSYYAHRGWDTASGRPTRTTLETLGLGHVADALGLAK
jgi:aldehyde:ferredoxin oxidoreductase